MKRDHLVKIGIGVFGAVFGSGAIFPLVNYRLEMQKLDLEKGQKIIDYYSAQRDNSYEMLTLFAEQDAIHKKYMAKHVRTDTLADGTQVAVTQSSGIFPTDDEREKLRELDSKIISLRKLYNATEKQLASLENRVYQEVMPPKPPRVAIISE